MFYYMFALIILSFNLIKVDFNIEDFSRLYPLEGIWTAPFKEGQLVEKWEKKFDKLLQGETFYLQGDKEHSQEKINLSLRNGRIYYTPRVPGQNNDEPVSFTLIEIDNRKFIFENKDHDFPQRITYEIKTVNELIATVEGETDEGFKKIEYKFKRKEDF